MVSCACGGDGRAFLRLKQGGLRVKGDKKKFLNPRLKSEPLLIIRCYNHVPKNCLGITGEHILFSWHNRLSHQQPPANNTLNYCFKDLLVIHKRQGDFFCLMKFW